MIDAKDLRIDIYANFKQYKFELPEIIRMDVGVSHFRGKELFDAIICDPPYGLRAAIKTSEVKNIQVEEEKKNGLLLRKIWEMFLNKEKFREGEEISNNKTCDDMVRHLFDLARVLLKKKGKLVYLYPVMKEKY